MRRKTLLLLCSLPVVLMLWGFAPFSEVQNVCPTCPLKGDVVVFTTGYKLTCKVVAQNGDYYVLERYGELRAAARSEVTSIEWANPASATSLPAADQILTRNNVLYNGTITAEQPGRYLVIQAGPQQHVIWHSQVYSVHRQGVVYPLRGADGQPMAPAPGAAPAPETTPPAAESPASPPSEIPEPPAGTTP